MSDLTSKVRLALMGPCGVVPGGHLLVACSGGRDSTVLLHVLADLAGDYPLQLSAVTVDHGLRGDAGRELEWMDRVSAQLGVPWASREISVAVAVLHAHGPEAAAREARYTAIQCHAASVGADAVAVAHHLQDQAETVLMRVLVGTGLRGLSAMKPRTRNLVRPLLAVDEDVIDRFAKDRSIQWLEDPSNADRRFLRNRVRHDLMPGIREVFGPSGARHLAALARRASGDERILVELAQEKLAEVSDALGWLAVQGLQPMDPALAIRVLHERVRQLQPEISVSQQHSDAILNLIMGDDRAAGVDLPGGLRVERVGDALRALRPADPVEACPDVPLPTEGVVTWPTVGIRVRTTVHADPTRVACEEGAGRSRAWFDLDRLTMPLSMRKFPPGARFRPFGSQASRKIGDLLGEAGIPRRLRPCWPIVTDAEQVLWVPGARAADVARVRSGTRRILELSMG